MCVNSRFTPCIVASPPPPTCHHRLFWLSLSARPFAKPNAENDPSGTNKEVGDDDKTRIDLGGGGSHGWFAKETAPRVGGCFVAVHRDVAIFIKIGGCAGTLNQPRGYMIYPVWQQFIVFGWSKGSSMLLS